MFKDILNTFDNQASKSSLKVGACFMRFSPTDMTRVKSTNPLSSSCSSSSLSISFTNLLRSFYFSAFLLSKPSTMSEYICPPSSKVKPLTIMPYFYWTAVRRPPSVVFLAKGPMVHLSQIFVTRLSWTFIF